MFNDLDVDVRVNPKGLLPKMLDEHAKSTVEKERQKLLTDKSINDKNMILHTLLGIKEQNSRIIKQNSMIIKHLEKLASGPQGDVHFLYFKNYSPKGSKDYTKIFIDFERGDRDGRSIYPKNSDTFITFPYSKIYMLKITNDGPADIDFKTNRHYNPIVLKSGETETINENENYQITELYINNLSTTLEANIRVIVYA